MSQNPSKASRTLTVDDLGVRLEAVLIVRGALLRGVLLPELRVVLDAALDAPVAALLGYGCGAHSFEGDTGY